MGRRTWLAGTTVALVVCGVTTCSRSPQRPRSHAVDGFIAVVGAGRNDPLWPVLKASALRQQQLVGDLGLRAEAPPVTSSRAQIRLINELRKQGMRGLCVQVNRPQALAPVLSRLANDGVVVVTMLQAVDRRFLHCGLDPVRIGESLADTIADALGHKGTIAVLHGVSRSACDRTRYEAFAARINHYPRVTVLRTLDCAEQPGRAREMIRDCMRRFPRLNGWVATGNWPLRGLTAGEPLLPRQCKLVTTGPHPRNWEHLANGTCTAMIAADYDRIAEEAVFGCVALLDGQLVRARKYLAPPRVLRPPDVHRFKTQWMRWCSHLPPGDR